MFKHIIFFTLLFGVAVNLNAEEAETIFERDPQEVREEINSRCMSIEAKTPEVYAVEDFTIQTCMRSTPIRIYTPADGGQFPLILMIHGGGWVGGNLDTHDNLARYLCQGVEAVVVSVEYENSPEGKFPLPLEQCLDALFWTKENQAKLHVDDRLAIFGDSAGGNLTAALCLMIRDFQGPRIDLQVLLNPAPDLRCEGTLEPQGEKLDVLRWMALMYVQAPEDVYHPYVSPLAADQFADLPPTLVLLAEHDDLKPDGERYANRLKSAHVPTNVYCQLGVSHLAGDGARASDVAKESLDVAVSALRGSFQR